MIIGPIFYDDTVNAARYVNNILSQLFAELTREKRLYGVIQQNSAITHMAYICLEALRQVFGDRINSRGIWPPCSPNLTPCGNYLWVRLKEKSV
jgi:hypothetical protein